MAHQPAATCVNGGKALASRDERRLLAGALPYSPIEITR
jgi:hypothetical protein